MNPWQTHHLNMFKPTNNVAHVGSFERSHNATSRPEWLVVATLPNKKTNSFPLKMVIFHSYVSLPEGIYIYIHANHVAKTMS